MTLTFSHFEYNNIIQKLFKKSMRRETVNGIMTLIGATIIHHTYGFLYASGNVHFYILH